MSELLFVYGTLRRTSNHPMAAYLARNGRFVGRAKTPGQLYDLGPYPGMLPAVLDSDWVHGDLFALPSPVQPLHFQPQIADLGTIHDPDSAIHRHGRLPVAFQP